MILMWAGPAIPTGWTCISCVSGDVFYQKFIVGSSTAGLTGGSASHTHTATGVVNTSAGLASLGNGGPANYASVAHTHTFSPIISTVNNLPSYRNLVIIQNNSAGEPTSIPTGAIAVFDAAVATGWTRYSAQDGFYVRGESTANRGATAGSNTHTHTITGTTAAAAGTAADNTGGATAVANSAHTHTVSSNTASGNSEPPYVQAILGQLNATGTMPNGVIAMWSDTPPTDWNSVSGTSAAFENRFVKPSATYGSTGGSTTETPADVTGITSSVPSATTNRGGAGTNISSGNHTHSINVTAFTTGSILPVFRTTIFGKRAGGQPPAAPTITNLFDNEKTGTSTPSFNFVANDPVGTDSLIYQFQWATTSTFASTVGNRTSDVETGCSPNCFQNTVTGGNTSPFNETENIKFTIQTALTDGTTYYWRVRAKKSTGSTYGSWSTAQSFTYVSGTSPSQWMQTADGQFSSDTFSSAEVYGADKVRILQSVPSEVMVVYGEAAATTPKYRIWNGTTLGSQGNMVDVGSVPQWVKTAAGTTRNEYAAGTEDVAAAVNVQIYNGGTGTWGNKQTAITAVPSAARRGFDIAYETKSGNLMVAYCNGTDAAYRTWNGTTWSGQTTITTVSANSCNYVALTSNPASNEIIMVTRDTGAQYEAQVWSGSSWGNSRTLGSMSLSANIEGAAAQYANSGNAGMVVVSNNTNNNFLWTTWNGTEWSTPTTVALFNDFEWGDLKRDTTTDNMTLCYIDRSTHVGIVRWDGSAWSAYTELDTVGNSASGKAPSCSYETSGARAGYVMIPYSDTTAGNYRFWNGSTLSTKTAINTNTHGYWESKTVRAGDGKLLSLFHDDVSTQYDFTYWNGTSWAGVSNIETNSSVTATPFLSPLDMTAKVYQPSSGTVISPPINFTSVSGQKTWGEVAFNTTEPSGTSLKVQVMYATSTYCNIPVPNAALAGNSVGFAATTSPINISGVSTTTYNKLCLKASLASTNASTPTLDDWSLLWVRQPYLVQSQYRWYANTNWITPSDPWPSGGTDLAQNTPIPLAYSTGVGSQLRLRMDLRSDHAALSASKKYFKLQYGLQNGSCASTTAWSDVGAIGSTTAAWRGYDNLLAFDGFTITTLLLSGSDVGGTYEEQNNSAINPNSISTGNEEEWDWTVEQNTPATNGSTYCFRMVSDAGVQLSSYEQYPQVQTNTSPQAPALSKPFDNAQVASTTPWFEFSSLDTENDDVTYQVQVDDTYDFSSTVLDRNSLSNLSEFENIVTSSDKDPFSVGQTVRFIPTTALTNGTTYYWRVRAKDVNGSNNWGQWSTIYSVTVDTSTTITTWYQTKKEQFDTNNNTNVETSAFDDLILTTGFTTGSTTSGAIDFNSKSTGNAWGSLSWNNNITLGTIKYRIEYFNGTAWVLVPDSYLPSNSTGFSSSPVSLLGLDPLVHTLIRVRADFTNTTGTPRLQDWTLKWGLAVEQPTLTALFDNEKSGTTTPTFKFKTNDPQSDDIQYQFSWSTDSTFASGTTTKTSGTNTGFTNVTNGADTSPFFSGNTISYKMQTALTNGTTYYWRVRGRDPSGGNAWSVWSATRSFTIDTAVTVSTWFQTLDPQFATDELDSTEVSGSGGARVASVIRDALVAYAEGTVQTPRYRLWNGSTWGTEGSAQSVGGTIRFVKTEASKTRDEYLLGTQDATGRVRVQVYNGSTGTWGNLNTIITAVPGLTSRGFDMTYEQTSGNAMVVACNGTAATYWKWNGTAWSGPTAITLATAGNCNWIELAAKPSSNEIIMAVRDTTLGVTDYNAQVWNGTTWGNSMTMGSMSEANDEGMAVNYEESGTRGVVVVSNGANASFFWNSWNGAAWTGAVAQATIDDFENGHLERDVGTDNMVLCSIHNNTEVQIIRWTGSTHTWNAAQTVNATSNAKTGKPVGCQYETNGARDGYIMIPYADTTNARWQYWDGTALSTQATLSTILDSQEVQSIRTGDGNILSFFYDDTRTEYDFSYWNGTAWATNQVLNTNSITTTVPPTIPIGASARKYPTLTSGNVYSSTINFNDGSGLKWQQLSFADTRPGSSNILYHVQYFDGSKWNLVPNSALSGNSTGFTSSPVDISGISRITYKTIRIQADLNCVSGSCPTINDWTVTWSAGINVQGTIKQYNQTASTTSGTVAVAVNGVLQAGKTATISNGAWSIPNVTAFPTDIVTVFLTGAANTVEAVGVTRYDGVGDITGMPLFERHVSLGSNEDATTTPITNADLSKYDFTNTEDVFFDVTGTTLNMCADAGCQDDELYVMSGIIYSPSGRSVMQNFENNGTFIAGAYTHEITGSWDNNAAVTMTGSSIVFAATTSSAFVDSTGASSATFNNVTFGTTTGNATFTLPSALVIGGNLTVSRGTLSRGSTAINVAGNLTNGSAGVWAGIGTTTFDGATSATWQDQNATLQNVGKVVDDGTSKLVTLAGNVKAQTITIGANDTLDASTNNYSITVMGSWYNQNHFTARAGSVLFAATTTSQKITEPADSFYNLSFTGTGSWSFVNSTINIDNDLSVSAGTLTLPTATSTIAGSFVVSGSGTFAHNNGILNFTTTGSKNITMLGTVFNNAARNMVFNGPGSWTFTDTNATTTADILIQQGTVNFPSGTLAIGGKLTLTGGSFNGGAAGTVLFNSTATKILTAGGSSFRNIKFNGSGGAWSFADASVTVLGDVTVTTGTFTLPTGTLTVGGSWTNSATVTPGTGTVLFNATATGKTINLGSSPLYNATFNSGTGGWTISQNATTTNNFTITNANAFTLASAKILSVGGTFTNSLGGAPTTWTGSTLALRAGTYSLNAKGNTGDTYNILNIAASTKISMWNSSASTYTVNSTGYLYSQNHNSTSGDLYIFGAYTKTGGNEYWDYATDFDGTALGGSPRKANVKFAAGASAAFTNTTVSMTGISTASTTVDNQGSGNYTVSLSGGSLSADYYQFSNMGSTGLSLLKAVSVSNFGHATYNVSLAAATAITLSSTTINANPSKQILNVRFATSSAIAAKNVTQTDGIPTSFWWFRTGFGNLYGENYDNDTGNPGSVRFDDSSIVVTISGTVYTDAGVTPLTGGTCNGVAQSVKIVVNGGTSYTGSCSAANGSYSISGVTFSGDPNIVVYLDNASGGQKGSVVTRTLTGNVSNMDIYANRMIVRHEDVAALTIANMAPYDFDNDTDLRFIANGGTLKTLAGTELYVWKNKTFTPGGLVTLTGNAGSNTYDGSLNLGNGATINAYSTTTLSIAGRLTLGSQSIFNAASTTVLMNATTSGKSITATSSLTFNNLTFNGSGGTWNLGANITANSNIAVTTGTVTGTGNISLPNGSISGNGILSLGAGTTTISKTNTFGGTSAWTFYNLQLGSGLVVGTTTPPTTATTTIAGKLTIAAAHFLNAGGSKWDLSGTSNVFTETGTFIESTSTVRYSGAGSNVLSTGYYNLDINSGSGSQTYIAGSTGILVSNNLTVGGTANSTFDVDVRDPSLDVNGSVTIRSNGTLTGSNSASFTIAGNYTNSGTFTPSGGTVTFDGTGSVNAGNSSFSTVKINTAGSVTFTQNSTSTSFFRLQAAAGFTVSSGKILAVGGTFLNTLGGAPTTWTGSTLNLYGGGNYSINAATTTDTYGTLTVKDTTQIRMWNSDASSYTVNSTASLYSQNHANTSGELYIFGAYKKTSGSDYWSYATNFDGTALGGSSRKVNVRFASGASALFSGGSIAVNGISTASTTITNQGSGSFGLTIGGSASTSLTYYQTRNINSSGLVFTGAPTINSLNFGDLEVSVNAGTAMTVGGTVITANPAKTINKNRFALNGVGSGFNVTATGTTVSAWRFANHYGGLDGETNDVDPGGDPGYIGWDNSTALITVSGKVYSDEGATVSTICNGSTNNVTLRVAGVTSYSTSCNASTGLYTINSVSYGSADSLVVYIDGMTQKGATVTRDPVSNISNLDIYENRVIVRHENTSPVTIANMAVWDSSGDADIPFTATLGSPNTLTLPANRKLIVWASKTFAPGGNVTLSGGGAGASYDGTLELFSNAAWTGAGTQALSVGGSFILDSNATLTTANGTTTFTTTGASRTIDLNSNALYHVAFTGSGSWTMTDPVFTASGNVSQSAGTLTMPAGTSTFNGSLIVNGGTVNTNGGKDIFAGTGGKTLKTNGSNLATTIFSGGNYSMIDTNATSTGSTTIKSGTITLPSGIFSVGRDFKNTGGAITHNGSTLVLRSTVPATLLASSSDLSSVRFAGSGVFTMGDKNSTFTNNFTIAGGASVLMASGTVSVGGSFDASGGTFTNATTTFLFNASATGKTINPGSNSFYSVQISAPSGGYTITNNATTTRNFTLSSASTFSLQSAKTLKVLNVFTNNVGGSNTTWDGALALYGSNNYTINTKSGGADKYNILKVGPNTDIRMWNSSATTTTVNASGSLYSQDHASVDGYLYIFGDYHDTAGTDYWNYAKDFDGTILTGTERNVNVFMASNATTTVDGGTLQMIGASGHVTTIANQGSGTYAFKVTSGTLNALYYAYRNLNASGLNLSGTPTISSLSNGDFELAVSGGTLITLASSTLNANASKVITGNRFATTSAITGKNVTLSGTTGSAWTFSSYTGNLAGEAYDVDGGTACGSVRWSDSTCLITQQTHYRWRNDDGGTDVPNAEWFNTGWAGRKSISIDNPDATTYTNAVVQTFVTYDSDMRADFGDLRFTQSDGITQIPYWIGSSTNSSRAEVWLKVPSLPAQSTAKVYMYFNKPSATASSSVTNTFIAGDDFNDGNITEYSGQTGLFNVRSNFKYDGGYGLDSGGTESSRTNTGGIYRLDQTVSQGQTFRFMKYVDISSGSGDEACTKFGVQSPGTSNNNYAICFEQFGTDRISLVKNAVDNESSGTVLASTTATFATGWYQTEVKWKTNNTFVIVVKNAVGTQIASFTGSDSTYTSGGYGFSYWFNYGGWDSVSSRPTLTTEPTVRFGAKQGRSGATWKAAQDTLASYNSGDIARLRVSIENTGTAVFGQQMRLEYAAQGASPSCEAVSAGSYAAVPNQASCGTSPVCMQATSYYADGAAIGDHLFITTGLFTAGKAIESPSNKTASSSIGQNQYTEVEYAITPTTNTVDQSLCFRVTNNGASYDTYLNVPKMSLRFDPTMNTPTLNNGRNIALLPGTTTRVYATGTVTDLNGYTDLARATTTFYRSGVSGGAACTANNNNCYISSTANSKCSFISCSGNSCTLSCYADIYYHADPTDTGTYAGQQWYAFSEVRDTSNGYGFNTSAGMTLSTLKAINVIGPIGYTSVAANSDTGATNASTTVQNQGNSNVDVGIQGTDLTNTGNTSRIPANQQKFATSTFTYSTCTTRCHAVSSTTPYTLDVILGKPTTASPLVNDHVYWGIQVPIGTASNPHSGYNLFYAI